MEEVGGEIDQLTLGYIESICEHSLHLEIFCGAGHLDLICGKKSKWGTDLRTIRLEPLLNTMREKEMGPDLRRGT